MSLRTPLARVLNDGSAHDGVGHWVTERATALALAPLSIWLLVQLLSLPHTDHAAISAWVAAGWNPVWLSLTVLLAAWHSWLGVQMVVEDYVHGALTKTLTMLALQFIHFILGALGIFSVLRIAFGSAA
jgi:succinate dehydrogenase / fumarate reductase membrane anchor subunit